MAVRAQVLRHGGNPVHWAEWGSADVKPGSSTTIGSGLGPFFEVLGVQNGANFRCGLLLNITLKVNGVAQQEFQLTGNGAGTYRAVVSTAPA